MKRLVLSSLALLAFAANAHTAIESAKPANGAVLDSSPPTIELKFKHAVQMTSIVVLEADKSERKLTFTPPAAATTITIAGLKPRSNASTTIVPAFVPAIGCPPLGAVAVSAAAAVGTGAGGA